MTSSSTFTTTLSPSESADPTKFDEAQAPKPKQRRGFALLSTAQMAKIAAMGGTKAHAVGHAHKWTRAEAKEAAAKSVGVRQAQAQARKVKGTDHD